MGHRIEWAFPSGDGEVKCALQVIHHKGLAADTKNAKNEIVKVFVNVVRVA